MIEINVTLIVQAVHFIIAWKFLSYFLFRPLVNVVLEEQSKKDELLLSVEEEQIQIKKLQKDRDRSWALYRKKFQRRVPVLIERSLAFEEIPEKKSLSTISEQEERKIIDQAVHYIVKDLHYD